MAFCLGDEVSRYATNFFEACGAADALTSMIPVRLLFVVSVLGFAAALLVAGCASAPPIKDASASDVQITVHPWQKPVRLVGKTPSRERYAFVGKVRVVARDGEFVESARSAQDQLRDQARTLGADVVKIDVVADRRAHATVLVGRAYRSTY